LAEILQRFLPGAQILGAESGGWSDAESKWSCQWLEQSEIAYMEQRDLGMKMPGQRARLAGRDGALFRKVDWNQDSFKM
jgi:hypothetical protein